jgi:hypothetical protein
MNSTAIVVAVVSSLVSGLVGVVISAVYYRKYDRMKLRREVLRRFVGNRHLLVGPTTGQGEPFVALNEVFVVFSDAPAVISAIKKMHEELGEEGRLVDNIVTLTKAMACAAGVRLESVNDSFIEKPFTPGGRS